MSQAIRPAAATRAVRASIASDTAHGAVVPPVYLSTNFAFEGFNKARTFDYTRSGNPTRAQLGDAIADLEGGAGAVVTSTGMSAVLLPLQLLSAGDVVVAPHDCYGGTQRLLRALAKRQLLDVVFADLTSTSGIEAITAHRPGIVLIETPSNPLLRITDVRRVSDAAHAAGARVVVDNTFLSPVLQRPIELGADMVVHSTTKYLNGHSDVVGGAVVAVDKSLAEELAWWANCLGVSGAPFDSYLTLRGVRTLFARVNQHQVNTESIVHALTRHPAVERVHYPGLDTHPGHEIARAQQSGYGAMVSFEVAGGTSGVELLVSSLTQFTLAESLGGVESLVAHPATMTHASMEAADRAAAGISDSLVRLSVGIESASDLVRDLTTALDRVARKYAVPQRLVRQRTVAASTPAETTDIILVGVGGIGRELIGQLAITGDGGSPRLRVCGLVDRSGFVFDPQGIPAVQLRIASADKAGGKALAQCSGARAGSAFDTLAEAMKHGLSRPVIVDLTAADTGELLRAALGGGCDAVLANKIPLAGDQCYVDALFGEARRAGRRVLHEATVGAGLPVIDTLRKLREAGDEILAVEGCPSGTLGYLFGELSRDRRFSDALTNAIDAGFTEPDPRTDLSGIDVARKALILARLIGFRGNLSDVAVESLVPDSLGSVSREEFIARASECNEAWTRRVDDARRSRCVLRYRARVTPESVTVGLVPVPVQSSLGVLSGTDNQFAFTTWRYRTQPLVITGPGAGAGVTAAGVQGDLRRLSAESRGRNLVAGF